MSDPVYTTVAEVETWEQFGTAPRAPIYTVKAAEFTWTQFGPHAVWTVFDEAGDPIENAAIEVDGETYTTDANGAITITGIEAGEHEVTVSAAGKVTETATAYIASQPAIDYRHFVMVRARGGVPSLGGLVTRRG